MKDNYNDIMNLLKELSVNQLNIQKEQKKMLENNYTQIESLIWLKKQLKLKGRLPPLRGWAASPDFLLKLHSHILNTRPYNVVEFGSGASTIVIADALRQNGVGRLLSMEHSQFYANQTISSLRSECLNSWVDIRISNLVAWNGFHINERADMKPSMWYQKELLTDVQNISLVVVDGPPASTCQYARYPALLALENHLSDDVQIWMDDASRKEEKVICQKWAEDYGFNFELLSLEKGLGILC
ncbi:class I SAM-dependent methyltransferase [Vreelandella zhanjiangensis]|uniref:class I SAM-dependent methyltransferase n=1 Tax=Vreelandella zhanjiangensis TaxID=1121960 RepID=UPI0003735913|nr:class I SAM-dependent methyltransferase [Halomonas zhanjiangensis]